ncbi:MAG: hypothetical protein KGY74_07485 [Candidatus Cloacimonetes bacterium]|nr:hypothetical protein [Candidatus Cloacimonadota bacterium]
MKLRLLLMALMAINFISCASNKTDISIFYKEKDPSQRVLTKVKPLLKDYAQSYEINYFNIEHEKNADIIKNMGLPETHFPVAVVIGDKFTAEIDDRIVSFVHFPLFMKGIGRHEGNWSLEDLRLVLENNDLLYDENILPVLDEESETTECEE